MGKVLSLMGRPFRNFNIESRAHELISKEKPVPAPKYASDQIAYEQMMKENPEIYNEGQVKHEQLDKHLRDVYVKSHDPDSPQKSEPNPNRPLPLDRRQVTDFEYGIKEPEKIPEGRTTLKLALKFIGDHQNSPKLHTPDKIAEDYKIPVESIENILKYYKLYEVYVPEQRKVKAKFAGPYIPRIKITPQPRPLLSGKQDKNDT